MQTGGTPIWQGACHCRRTRFTVAADIDHTRICDCSICHQRGALIFRVKEDALKLLTPLDDLALYQWGTGTAKDYFCKTCVSCLSDVRASLPKQNRLLGKRSSPAGPLTYAA